MLKKPWLLLQMALLFANTSTASRSATSSSRKKAKSPRRRKLAEVAPVKDDEPDCQLKSFRTDIGVFYVTEEGDKLAPYFFREQEDGNYEVRLMSQMTDVDLLLPRIAAHGYGPMQHENVTAWQFFQCMMTRKINIGEDMPNLALSDKQKQPTQDDIVAFEIALLSSVQVPLLKRRILIGDDVINPSLFKWQGEKEERWVRIDSSFCCAQPGTWQQRDALRIVAMNSTLMMHYRIDSFQTDYAIYDTSITMDGKKSITTYSVAPNNTRVYYSSFRGQVRY